MWIQNMYMYSIWFQQIIKFFNSNKCPAVACLHSCHMKNFTRFSGFYKEITYERQEAHAGSANRNQKWPHFYLVYKPWKKWEVDWKTEFVCLKISLRVIVCIRNKGNTSDVLWWLFFHHNVEPSLLQQVKYFIIAPTPDDERKHMHKHTSCTNL